MMLKKVLKKFNIRDHEWPRLAALTAVFFLITMGGEFGFIASDSYFLSTAGPEKIPFMFIVIAVLMVIVSPIYNFFSEGKNRDSLLRGIAVGGTLCFGGIWLLVRFNISMGGLLPYIVFCTAEIFDVIIFMTLWIVAEQTFGAEEGKRFFPIIGSVRLVGKVFGGLTTSFIAKTFGAAELFLVWGAVLLALFPLARLMERVRLKYKLQTQSIAIPSGPKLPGETGSTRDSSLRKVPLIYTLTFMAFPMWIITYILEYSYFDVMTRVFPDPNQLAGFFGIFRSITTVLALLILLFIAPRMLRTRGVGGTVMIYAFSLTTGSILLLLFSLFPGAQSPRLDLFGIALLVAAARACGTSFYFSVWSSPSQLLFYSLPQSLRTKGRTFISGIAVPLSTALAGVIIILFTNILKQPLYSVAFVAVTLGFLLVALALNITPEYLSSLLRNFTFSNRERLREIMAEIDRLEISDARYVLMLSAVKKDVEEARFAVEKLFEIRDDELLHDLEEALPDMLPETVEEIINRLKQEESDEAEAFIRAAAKYRRHDNSN